MKSRWLPRLALILVLTAACRPDEPEGVPEASATPLATAASSEAAFVKAQNIMTASCMPCHNHQNLPVVIERVRKAKFERIDLDTRKRILAELQELQGFMKEGMSLSFNGKKELHSFFGSTPSAFYVMLERGVMPPPWAPELMRQIDWQSYQPLTPENRVELLKYAKPFAEKYMR